MQLADAMNELALSLAQEESNDETEDDDRM